MKHQIKRIHFVGIGGSGMSGIAELLHNLGYSVSGSDLQDSASIAHLKSLGIKTHIGHQADNIGNAQVVVSSSAIDSTHNPELIAARMRGVVIVPRAMMLAELMRFKYGIAIAGTHGKTTTTSLCASVLDACLLDPTYIIGGKLMASNSNARLGSGEYLVAEADESDASFLHLAPLLAVVTNIDLDHMATYDHKEDNLKQAFIDFLHRLPFYGRAILCNEDERLRLMMPQIKRPIITYGFSQASDIYATNIVAQKDGMEFTLNFRADNHALNNNLNKELQETYRVTLNLFGHHNILNSLAVIAIAIECGCRINDIINALGVFKGVARRMQRYPDLTIKHGNNVAQTAILIDDYAHHPSEIKATLQAVRLAHPNNRLVLIFEPHRYTRTRDLFDEFVTVLSNVDVLILLEVYAAEEQPIALADSRTLMKSIIKQGFSNVHYASTLTQAKETLNTVIANNDLIVTMGAGSVAKLPALLSAD